LAKRKGKRLPEGLAAVGGNAGARTERKKTAGSAQDAGRLSARRSFAMPPIQRE
jgi:hypothetical protein